MPAPVLTMITAVRGRWVGYFSLVLGFDRLVCKYTHTFFLARQLNHGAPDDAFGVLAPEAMSRRDQLLLMVATVLSNFFRRSMASYAASGMRYAVELLAPAEGPVLGVAAPNAKASARPAYRVLQEPAEAPFDGLQVRAQK